MSLCTWQFSGGADRPQGREHLVMNVDGELEHLIDLLTTLPETRLRSILPQLQRLNEIIATKIQNAKNIEINSLEDLPFHLIFTELLKYLTPEDLVR